MKQTHRRIGSDAADHLAGINLHPVTVHEALDALETLIARLRREGDARAAFPDIYAVITRRVSEEVRKPNSRFLEPSWISRLAGRFCERYLETLAWSLDGARQDAGAWAHAYVGAARASTLPIQNVMLGLSAHINYDLALGIAATIDELGFGRDPEMIARFKHDHDQVNALLEESIPEAFARLVERHGCPATELLLTRAYRLASWTAMQLLQVWRERIWSDVLALLRADTAQERAAVLRQMDRRSTRIGGLLALPLPIPFVPAAPRPEAACEAPSAPMATVVPYRRPAPAAPPSEAQEAIVEVMLERLCA